MNDLFCAFVAAFVVPLLFQSPRVAILGLAVQGILLAMIPHLHEWSPQVVVEGVILLICRGFLAPWLLFRYGLKKGDDADFSLIGRNLFQWALAAALLVISFILGSKMAPDSPSEALQVGAATSCILIGMLILSNQNCRLGQAIGILTIESGMALIELLSPHPMPLPVSLGVYAVYIALLATIIPYLSMAEPKSSKSTIDDNKETA